MYTKLICAAIIVILLAILYWYFTKESFAENVGKGMHIAQYYDNLWHNKQYDIRNDYGRSIQPKYPYDNYVREYPTYPDDQSDSYKDRHNYLAKGKNVPHNIYLGANTPPYGRYGSTYNTIFYTDTKVPPAEKIMLVTMPGCSFHPLNTLFFAVKDLTASSAAQKNIEFDTLLADKAQLGVGALPRIVRVRPDGTSDTYLGSTNTGALYDWVMNVDYQNYRAPY